MERTLQNAEASGRSPEAVGLAGVSMAEALILLLIDKGLISQDDVQDTLQSAIDSHMDSRPERLTRDDHYAAASVIRQILKGANSVRASAHL
jgi:hypothetical protein